MANLCLEIQMGFFKKIYTVAVFLDISCIFALQQYYRYIETRDGLMRPELISVGVAQGSPLKQPYPF